MKDIKHIKRDFHSVHLVMHAPGLGTWEFWGQKFNFSEHGHMAYQI